MKCHLFCICRKNKTLLYVTQWDWVNCKHSESSSTCSCHRSNQSATAAQKKCTDGVLPCVTFSTLCDPSVVVLWYVVSLSQKKSLKSLQTCALPFVSSVLFSSHGLNFWCLEFASSKKLSVVEKWWEFEGIKITLNLLFFSWDHLEIRIF